MRLLGLVFIGLACCDGSPTEPSEPAICLQTFEFGNYGCGRIVGRLTYPPGSDAPVSDSIPITVRFAAVGERAPITRLNLAVPVTP